MSSLGLWQNGRLTIKSCLFIFTKSSQDNSEHNVFNPLPEQGPQEWDLADNQTNALNEQNSMKLENTHNQAMCIWLSVQMMVK